MEMFVLKNEDGNQFISKNQNDSENTIGVWKTKSVNQCAVYDALIKATAENKKLYNFSNLQLLSFSFSLTKAINNLYNKRRKEKEFLYIEILTFLKIIKDDFKNEFKDITLYDKSITISNVIKHFEKQNIAVKKEFVLSLYNDGYIFKSYQKIHINNKGLEYLQKLNENEKK
jgi:hypothetical protein